MSVIFHPLLALIASVTDRELAKYIQFLKEENKILRARVPGQIHTRKDERERLLKFGNHLDVSRVCHAALGGAVGSSRQTIKGCTLEKDCPFLMMSLRDFDIDLMVLAVVD